ncbi:MAG: hypothetical protein K6F53_05085 [Lachnospiraceae bacterium]|nr:hypothetical protein [Lachnospiraceae bacterium]
MEENIKLEKIKKSCGAGEKLTTVFCIIAIVGCVMTLIAGFAVLNMGKRFDDQINALSEEGKIDVTDRIGSFRLLGFNLGDPTQIESDVPAIREALKDHPYSVEVSMLCFLSAFMTAIMAVLMKMAGSVFALIRKEESPFTDKVIKRVLIVMIVLSGIVFLTAGTGSGALCGVLTWVVYTILDYGKTLQIQSDETL